MTKSHLRILMMFVMYQVLLLFGEISLAQSVVNPKEQANAEAFLRHYNKSILEWNYRKRTAAWNEATNITAHNREVNINVSLAYGLFEADIRKNASRFNMSSLMKDTARQLVLITSSTQLKSESERAQKEALSSKMKAIFSTAKVGNYTLLPGLVGIMAKSRDYDELLRVWWGWRNASGREMRQIYKEYVDLTNKGAKENGYADLGEAWQASYEVDDLPGIVEKLWLDLRAFYLELHAYVRYKLSKAYPGSVSQDDYIEAHLLGNMWAQSWVNIFDLVVPYKNKSSLDVTSTLKKDARYNTSLKLTRLAESFFVSLGLKKLPETFYEKSLLEKPKDRDVVCHASAWDFSLYKDVRIKQCVEINHNDLVTLHHELGHIQYILQYWELPAVYRIGANPGFHEAVGDLMSLSVDTAAHLEKLGLLTNYSSDEEADINILMKSALGKIAFLPFGYLIDQWRWKIFSGDIKPTEYNAKWWELRMKYQGVKSPVHRSEEDFDPGAKFHIPNHVPYIRYFVRSILQFQFHKAACEAAQFKGPLFKCSIYQSKKAGDKIAAMLRMGKSKPWPDALERMTGSREMSVEPMKEYFKSLQEWLVKERCSKKYTIGWPGQTADGVEACPKTNNANALGQRTLLLFLPIYGLFAYFN